MEIIGYIAIACIGLLLGSIGAGGSMLAIPVLVYIFLLDMETASAYAMFLVGVTSLAGALVKQREDVILARRGLLFAIPSLIASFATRKWLITFVPDVIGGANSISSTKDSLLLTLFSILMMSSSFLMLRRKSTKEAVTRRVRGRPLMVAGLVVGVVAGLAGAGGGFLILPSLVFFAGLPFTAAVRTTLFIIAANCLAGFCGDVLNHTIDWSFLLGLTALAISGLLLGYWSTKKLRPLSAQNTFGWLTLGIGVWILIKEWL